MDEQHKGPPINQDNIDAIVHSMERASESARQALEAAGPRITAAFEAMQKSLTK